MPRCAICGRSEHRKIVEQSDLVLGGPARYSLYRCWHCGALSQHPQPPAGLERAAKRRRGARRPIIEWQFIVFRYNEHELAAARELARQIGVDRFRTELAFFPPGAYGLEATPEQVAAEERWFSGSAAFAQMSPANLRRDGFLYNESCSSLYRGLFVTPRGAVNPCCFATRPDEQFGNLLDDDLATIWNNARYRGSRSLFGRPPAEHAGTLCDGCYLYRRPAAQPPRGAVPIPLYDRVDRSD